MCISVTANDNELVLSVRDGEIEAQVEPHSVPYTKIQHTLFITVLGYMQLGSAIGNAIAVAANSDNIIATQVTCTRIPRKPIFPLFGIFPRRGVRAPFLCMENIP